jgi:hypothetical protein
MSSSSALENTIPVPRDLFDRHLPVLKESELRILLVVVRQTLGFRTSDGRRKERDWLSQSQFREKTGLATASISQAIATLVARGLVMVTTETGHQLLSASDRRRHRGRLFFSLGPALIRKSEVHIPNITKETKTKKVYKEGLRRHRGSGWSKASDVRIRGGLDEG